MTDSCPRCAGPLHITGVEHDQWAAVCMWCEGRAHWNETALAWDPYFPAWRIWALATVIAVLLWIVGHAEVMS